jgi:hypothetical protein
MMRKLLLACAAIAALGTAAFAPSDASAREWHSVRPMYGSGHGYHGHRNWGGGPRFGFAPRHYGSYASCYQRRLVPTPWGPRWRTVNRCY